MTDIWIIIKFASSGLLECSHPGYPQCQDQAQMLQNLSCNFMTIAIPHRQIARFSSDLQDKPALLINGMIWKTWFGMNYG